jgi:DMSO/TMAO reductase YedYZ molybdopterin-dependent catalytic subunit
MNDEQNANDAAALGEGGETKLTRTKQRWAREGRFLTGRTARPDGERLPPGQHLVKDWPVLGLGQHPTIPRERWELRVAGLVDRPVAWNWAAFAAQPQSDTVSDIHCVTSWSRYDNAWQGLTTRDLIATVRPRSEARFVLLKSYDDYSTNVALEDFAAADAMLAHGWQGAPLTPEHGGPVRLVIPHLYFWKSAKWIRRIEFVAEDRPGFWEVRGYHNHADPWTEERYADPDR